MMDHAELDFGIYRIMNQKRDDIMDFLENRLLKQVGSSLDVDEKEVEKLQKRQKEILQMAGGDITVLPPAIPLRREYDANEEQLRKLGNPEELRNEVFSHLVTFFSCCKTVSDDDADNLFEMYIDKHVKYHDKNFIKRETKVVNALKYSYDEISSLIRYIREYQTSHSYKDSANNYIPEDANNLEKAWSKIYDVQVRLCLEFIFVYSLYKFLLRDRYEQ